MANGVKVGAVTLTARHFGGLLSGDDLHFSDTTYARLANEFAGAINTALGTHLPPVDLEAVLAQDPWSVAKLRAAGFSCAGP